MSTLTVSRIQPEQWEMLKDVRLRALSDAPYAFGTTFEEAKKRPSSRWQSDALDHATQPGRAYFLAYAKGIPSGMAGCYRPELDTAHLTAMWVAPEVRPTNLGVHIVNAAVKWAQSYGTTTLEAWVSEDNVGARAFYQKIGFKETKETEPLRSNPKIQSILIRLNLTPENRG
jgi:GNAT superfamily N-acetyltransferase